MKSFQEHLFERITEKTSRFAQEVGQYVGDTNVPTDSRWLEWWELAKKATVACDKRKTIE